MTSAWSPRRYRRSSRPHDVSLDGRGPERVGIPSGPLGRMRIQFRFNKLPAFFHIFTSTPKCWAMVKFVFAQVFQMPFHQRYCQWVLHTLVSQILQLKDHTFTDVPRADSRRLETAAPR